MNAKDVEEIREILKHETDRKGLEAFERIIQAYLDILTENGGVKKELKNFDFNLCCFKELCDGIYNTLKIDRKELTTTRKQLEAAVEGLKEIVLHYTQLQNPRVMAQNTLSKIEDKK